MTKTHYDIIVIGAGAGGLNIASFMNRVGFSVLLIDRDDKSIGGDCLNYGCIPSKALIHAARVVSAAHEAKDFGLDVSGQVSWSAVKTHIQNSQKKIRVHENADWFRQKGIDVVLGEASFDSPDTVVVEGNKYQAKRIVIATGSTPRQLSTSGIEKVQKILNNENIFSIDSLPASMLIVGAGPIGIEIATAMNALGVEVSVVDPGQQILSKEDSEVAGIVHKKLVENGVVFYLGCTLEEFTSERTANLKSIDGEQLQIHFESVFTSIGRVTNIEPLKVEKAGIKTDERGKMVIDKYLRTSNRRIFVCGDVAGNFQFTHAAEMHATVILKNFFSPVKQAFDATKIAWSTYSNPEVATFGLSAKELMARGISFTTVSTDFNEDDRAITDKYSDSLVKIYISKKGLILGGTMVAPNAGELVQELILAQQAGISVSTLFSKTYPYPTATRINKRALGLHMANRLTKTTSKILQLLYRFNW